MSATPPLASRFLSLPAERRTLAFEQTAAGRAGQQVMLEKDFWVTWLLGVLFALPEVAPHLVFKGGTSLSKVYSVIDRFSEDIDLCLMPDFVGADAAAFDALGSRTRRDAAVLEMQQLCGTKAQEIVQPALEARIREALGAPQDVDAWLRYEVDAAARSPIIYFRYPTQERTGFAYIQREVKLELGTLTDQQPTGRYPIRPLVADAFPALFDDWQCEVTTLVLERTFWEKATILHSEFYRPPDQSMPDRYARHYSDMARLLEREDAARNLADAALCAHVVDWKGRVFPRAWARYDLARAGSFRLVPAESRRAALAQDYAAMQQMFISTPPAFEQVLERLAEAEAQLNAGREAS
ncbi:nucleotidyl transferase AbiEii/AbiGii toxin family protein [Variovorax sp. DXTD-1]|uniref:nucleotidyl transferase AbiEii/AbiGii toxin family protein n=1 Tax=Variovorax sp. DXTD-1 TaxID=2495592 RepID=UPI000F896B8E|nr:nucleotidyl transferase AbiEii/AbiGii toxin family protein [Variovorax sp. DXTD-1]RST49350.1 nucleotidyl transferase AbiEii/AbiGii toxin family protein [Variovorax sp. DXTD-1]